MKKIFLLLIILGSFFACSDERLAELNRPKKNASEVTGETLFANGLKNMVDLMASTDVNSNVFRLYAQYWAQTTYPDESQYNMVGREIPDNFWTLAYRDALMDLHEAARVIEATWEERGIDEPVKNNQIAQINISKVYMYSVLVDMFGAIPYDEALNPEILSPKYQPGEEVYGKIIDLLDASIASLDVTAGGFGQTQDLLYNDDTDGWLRFANSLKLRLAMNIADVNPGKSATMVSQAVASGLILDNAQNATLAFESETPNTNPIWEDLVQSGRADYVIANTVVDKLQDLNDPRLIVYGSGMTFNYAVDDNNTKVDSVFNEPAGAEYTLHYPGINGPGNDSIAYVEVPFTIEAEDSLLTLYLYKGGEYGTANTYSKNSHVGDIFHEPDLEGVLMDYSEVQFLLAEAAARGMATPMSVEGHYNEGIRASMEYWGVEEWYEGYILNPQVAYATAAGDWKQKIGTQEWIALYNRGYEGWTAWRRLDFTGFNVPDGLAESDIPRRLIFPIEEATLNPSNLDAAIGLIGGSDDVQTKVFWDVN